MTETTVNGRRSQDRSGAQTLIMLAAPLSRVILKSLSDEARPQAELRRNAGAPAQTTLRAQLKKLVEIGAIEKHRYEDFPGTLEYTLTPCGRELLAVARTIESWLADHRGDGIALASGDAMAAIKALAGAWSTTMLRALAARPLSLTELDRIIGSLSYPSLERRLSAMRLTGLVAAEPRSGRGTPYATTDWLRRGVVPLASAARWELRHRCRFTTPMSPLDIETVLLLSAPLLTLPTHLSGSCRIAAEASNGRRHRLAGATLDAFAGRIVKCSTKLEGEPTAWALGTIPTWLAVIVEGDLDSLEMGGDRELARSVSEAMHQSLSPVSARNQ